MATVGWISNVLQYAKSQCRAESIVPVLKVSGMNWKTNKVTAIHYDQAIALQNRHKTFFKREKTSEVPFFSYKTREDTGVVYYDDALSLNTKINQIVSMGFDKIVFWSLGRQDPALTEELKDYIEQDGIKNGNL